MVGELHRHSQVCSLQTSNRIPDEATSRSLLKSGSLLNNTTTESRLSNSACHKFSLSFRQAFAFLLCGPSEFCAPAFRSIERGVVVNPNLFSSQPPPGGLSPPRRRGALPACGPVRRLCARSLPRGARPWSHGAETGDELLYVTNR